MSAGVKIIRAGPSVSLQDRGRWGYLRYGVTPAGPMDLAALGRAVAAAGGATDAPAIEISLGGLEIEAEGRAICAALAGGAFTVRRDGAPMPDSGVFRLEAGSRLSISPGPSGAWAYLAFAARVNVPAMLGARATHARSRLGGLQGRALQAGDFLPLSDLRALCEGRLVTPRGDPNAPIRILWGPQEDYFTPEARQLFVEAEWRVAARSDRMAYRLDGPPLRHARGFNIVSDGVAMGAIQVPGDGAPLALMADRAPTGGYPKIAHIIGADLGVFAQRRPGEAVRFRAVSHAEAVAALRAAAGSALVLEDMSDIAARLGSRNLIDGVVSAF